jgi:hypothetical protein
MDVIWHQYPTSRFIETPGLSIQKSVLYKTCDIAARQPTRPTGAGIEKAVEGGEFRSSEPARRQVTKQGLPTQFQCGK